MKDRPKKLPSINTKIETGHGRTYINISFLNSEPFEVFLTTEKTNECTKGWAEALCRLISLCLRSDIKADEIIDQIEGISCGHEIWTDGVHILSVPDAIAKTLKVMISDEIGDEFKDWIGTEIPNDEDDIKIDG